MSFARPDRSSSRKDTSLTRRRPATAQRQSFSLQHQRATQQQVNSLRLHRLANIRAKLPDESASEVMAHLYAVRDAPTLDAALDRKIREKVSAIRFFIADGWERDRAIAHELDNSAFGPQSKARVLALLEEEDGE